MIRPDHDESVKFFTGTEVEHTPAYGMPTLFVVGIQQEEWIAYRLNGRRHIYFGANQSFPNPDVNDAAAWKPWEDMIRGFLDRDYLCTLDIDVKCVEGLLESGLCEHHEITSLTGLNIPRTKHYESTRTITSRHSQQNHATCPSTNLGHILQGRNP
jgi:hypothetical protein